MLKIGKSVPALAGVLFVSLPASAQFADAVSSYSPGVGISSAYSVAAQILGTPTVFNGYQNTDPFNPAYRASDLVGVGTGGSLTVSFNTPVGNNSANPFGLDFIIFGHAGLMITNGDYSGGGIGDGSFFTTPPTATRVSVSVDGSTFYTLNPALAPVVDSWFPTDAAGDFHRPVNPSLRAGDVAGRDLAGIRSLYNGSGGGAGYDIAWAQDSRGQSVTLSSINFVRIEVLGGSAYLDSVAVVPEPSVWALGAAAFLGWWGIRRRTC